MTLPLRTCFAALALFAAVPAASASPVAFDACPATRAELEAKLALLPRQAETSAGGTTTYKPEDARVFGVKVTSVISALDDRLEPMFSASFHDANKQFLKVFRDRYGKDVQCMMRSCHWATPRGEAASGKLASAHVIYFGGASLGGQLKCTYFR